VVIAAGTAMDGAAALGEVATDGALDGALEGASADGDGDAPAPLAHADKVKSAAAIKPTVRRVDEFMIVSSCPIGLSVGGSRTHRTPESIAE